MNRAAVWSPPALKFMLSDYTMEATSRTFNGWAAIVTAVFALGSVSLIVFRRGRRRAS